MRKVLTSDPGLDPAKCPGPTCVIRGIHVYRIRTAKVVLTSKVVLASSL
jgi:hypothetical protein